MNSTLVFKKYEEKKRCKNRLDFQELKPKTKWLQNEAYIVIKWSNEFLYLLLLVLKAKLINNTIIMNSNKHRFERHGEDLILKKLRNPKIS